MNDVKGADIEQLMQPNVFTIGFCIVFILISIGIGP